MNDPDVFGITPADQAAATDYMRWKEQQDRSAAFALSREFGDSSLIAPDAVSLGNPSAPPESLPIGTTQAINDMAQAQREQEQREEGGSESQFEYMHDQASGQGFIMPQMPSVGYRGDLIGETRRAGEQHRAAQGEAREALGEAGKRQQGFLQEQIQRSDEIAQRREQVYNDTLTRREAVEASETDVQQRRAESMQHAKTEVAEAQKDARYFGMERGERQRLESIANDDSRSDRERAQAKAKLQQAQDVDPDRALGGTGGKVMAAIAMALGAYGSGINGGPNHAMQIINAAIDRDINAQLERKRSLERQAGARREEMQDERVLFADETAELDRQRVRMLEGAKMKMERTDAQLQSVEQKGRLQQMVAAIDQEQALISERMANADYQNKMSEVGTVGALRGQQDAAAVQRYQAESGMIAAALKAEGEGKSLAARQASEIGDLDAAEKLVEELDQKFQTHAAGGIRGKTSILSQWFPTTKANEYNQAVDAVARQLALTIEGTVNKDSHSHYKQMLGTAATDKDTWAANVENMKRNIQRLREGRVGAYKATGYDTGDMRTRGVTEDTGRPPSLVPGV